MSKEKQINPVPVSTTGGYEGGQGNPPGWEGRKIKERFAEHDKLIFSLQAENHRLREWKEKATKIMTSVHYDLDYQPHRNWFNDQVKELLTKGK